MQLVTFSTFCTLFVSLFSAMFLVNGLPLVAPQKGHASVINIVYPHNGTLWHVGQKHNVTWYGSVFLVSDWMDQIYGMIYHRNVTSQHVTTLKADIFLKHGNATIKRRSLSNSFCIAVYSVYAQQPLLHPMSTFSARRHRSRFPPFLVAMTIISSVRTSCTASRPTY